MQAVRFIIVGGFLGAGKTTLLGQASRRLSDSGHRVGIITNDQAPQLVDSQSLQQLGLSVNEVAGGCFCCRFDQLIQAAKEMLTRTQPDVVLGEPVGSCTDLSATVIQPLKKFYPTEYRLSPFSVVADVRRVRDLFSGQAKGSFPASVLYIYEKQLEEADVILLNKIDLLTAAELEDVRGRLAARYPRARIRTICARSGAGVDEWLESMLDGTRAGERIVPVDYELYAEGEAELGWLNAVVDLHAAGGADWSALGLELMGKLRRVFDGRKAEVAHLKIFVNADGGAAVSSLTRTQDQPMLLQHGNMKTGSHKAELTINARVHLAPETLRAEVISAVSEVFGERAGIRTIESFRPGPPTPTHRFAEVVD